MLTHAAGKIATLVFGGRCFLCRGSAGDASDGAGILCAACERSLPAALKPQCPVCALASPRGQVCGRCLGNPPHFDATLCALEYRFPADVLVQALKFRGELSIAGFFGRLLLKRLDAAHTLAADCLTPVPLSSARLRERGFNQALEIARPLAREGDLRLEPELCRRTRDTVPQTDLPWKKRAQNLRGAFHCEQPIEGMSVAVLDDVMTTGATLNEVAKALKAAGARRVVNWVVARTPSAGGQ